MATYRLILCSTVLLGGTSLENEGHVGENRRVTRKGFISAVSVSEDHAHRPGYEHATQRLGMAA
jgi:hypothetical protein